MPPYSTETASSTELLRPSVSLVLSYSGPPLSSDRLEERLVLKEFSSQEKALSLRRLFPCGLSSLVLKRRGP